MKSKGRNYVIYIALWVITIVGAILSWGNRIAIPQFRATVYTIALLLILLRLLNKEHSGVKRIASTIALMVCVSFVYFISILIDPRESRFESVSPLKTNTIIVEYDFVSRPTLFRQTYGLFMQQIPFKFESGYNETVRHQIIWLTENQFKLTDYLGGEWIVDLK